MTARRAVLLVGAGGAQGLECARHLRAALPDRPIVGIDRHLSEAARATLAGADIDLDEFDIVAAPDRLTAACADAAIVVNLSGPFHALGTRVIDAAISAGADYVDICDDVDATAALLDCDAAAAAAGVRAVTGIGAAPGTTNLLVRLALDYLGVARGDGVADIVWVAPGSDLTPAIFDHLVHCFRTVFPDAVATPDWDALDPRQMVFPDPLGAVEVTRLGHPEPLTLARSLGCRTGVWGGMTTPGLHRRAWELARACDAGLLLADAWREIAADAAAAADDEASGMIIDVTAPDGRGVRFESVTTITMMESTSVPAAAAACLLLAGEGPPPGVHPPELLDPRAFFAAAARLSTQRGTLRAFTTRDGARVEPLSLRTMIEPR